VRGESDARLGDPVSEARGEGERGTMLDLLRRPNMLRSEERAELDLGVVREEEEVRGREEEGRATLLL
jgi:hypothetical protein